MSYSSVSGIQFPNRTEPSPKRDYSGPGSGGTSSQDPRRASVISLSMASGMESISLREPRAVEFEQESSFPAKRVYGLDLEEQRMKLYDARRRAHDSYYSNYLVCRGSRVLDDYRTLKYAEAFGTSESPRRGSGGGMGPRAGSLSQLIPAQVQPVQDGPVEQVEWFARDNAKEHRTDRYEIVSNLRRARPVYRRGQGFFMAIRVQGSGIDLTRQPVTIYFNFGSRSSLGRSTGVALTLNGEREFLQKDKSEWDIRLHHQDGNTLTIQVNVPSTAPVGAWSAEIHYNNEINYCAEDIYILFNPYCSEDPVHLDNEQFRREYVLSESGKVYTGTAATPNSYKWVYGQFSELVLPVTCLLLDRYTEAHGETLSYAHRGSPVYVARALASMIYSEFGILKERENRDENNYNYFSYTGSLSIFEKLIEQNFRPIQVNQNFIASALYVTLCRALGIPCRSLTTYRVPVDKNTLNLDIYWDEERERKSDLYEAYRCWNDVWMRRDDLLTPTSYLGWQAIDPNGQGFGPAPAEAVRRGEIGLNFDVFYFYAFHNSQFRHFYYNTYPEKIVTDDIGRLIVTKRCDRDDDDEDYEEITNLYKKRDGTPEERLAVFHALKGTLQRRASIRSLDKIIQNPSKGKDDQLSIDWTHANAAYGQNLLVSLLVQNTGSEARSLIVNFFARPLYQGLVGRKLKQFRRQFTLQPNQKESLTLELSPHEYQDRLDTDYAIRYYATVYNKDTDQFWAGDEDVTLLKPKINVQVRSVVQLDSEVQLNLTMANPLNVPLTDAYIFYEAPGSLKPVFKKLRDVKAGELLSLNEKVVPRQSGDSRLVVVFNSRQLRNVVSSKVLSVRD